METKGLLIFFHVGSNTGYAIGRLEEVFLEMGLKLTGDINNIHFGYTSLDGGHPAFLPDNFKNVIEFNPEDSHGNGFESVYNYIKQNKIEVAFGFDQPVSRPSYSVMRKAGVKLFVSYYGSPISSINHGLKLFIKKMEVKFTRFKPDYFIFESKACADTAIFGRGIPASNISVIPTGVDTDKFAPKMPEESYAHQVFNIPRSRKIIIYSGHMEERKGVHVIVKAAVELICKRKRDDVHFLFLGNKDGDEIIFEPLYSSTETKKYMSFGGYRSDIDRIFPSCFAGVIASTGWDSFPMSSLEMASSGLPIVASRLQGIVEGIDNGKTGYLIEPGDYNDLADKIELLLDDVELQKGMGLAARNWILEKFSKERQIENLTKRVRKLRSSYIKA
jgi:glycosyltransferase involved in cell wall biosynthesis